MSTGLLLILMALTTYRCTRLITTDTFPPVLWLRDRLAGGWRPMTQREIDTLTTGRDGNTGPYVRDIDGVKSRYVSRWSGSPYWLGELVSCPWCASGWIAGAVVLATDLATGLPDPWLAGPAVWAVGALLAAQEWA